MAGFLAKTKSKMYFASNGGTLGTAFLAAGTEIPANVIKTAQAATVIIRTPTGGGSGFIAKLDGKTYIVTNQHVVCGAKAPTVKITTTNGELLHPTSAEIPLGNVDLIRLEIQKSANALLIAAEDPIVTSSVAAIGNSLDAGVITVNKGTVTGVGPKDVESDCKFVPGNSGGPLINENGEVVAIPTRIVFRQ